MLYAFRRLDWKLPLGAMALACAFTSAHGQWSAINMHPPGAAQSAIGPGANGMFGGLVQESFTTPLRPALWQGLSSNWTALLAPTETFVGSVNAMWGNQQGGSYNGAALWTGTPQSRIDMGGEQINGMGPGQQVGSTTVQVGGVQHDHASMWSGTPGSMIDLNPSAAGFADSIAYATDGLHQGGYVKQSPSTGPHLAAMWTATAASYVNMNPSWSMYSSIHGMVPGQQVGSTQHVGSSATHATIWSGTAESAVDVHSFPGSGSSGIAATIGFAQVGSSHVPGFALPHAGVWFGTAASFVDLHQFLPPGFVTSSAGSIQEWNGQILVGGAASRDFVYYEAYVWVLVPAPNSVGAMLAAGVIFAARRRRRPVQ